MLCEEIINSGKKFNIAVETHLKNIDNKLADIFLKSGIKLVYVGIESADEQVRADAKRWSDDNDLQLEKINYLEKQAVMDLKSKIIHSNSLLQRRRNLALNTSRVAKKC